MVKKKNQKQKDVLKQKVEVESLTFQTNWGLKKLFGEPSEPVAALVETEIEHIAGQQNLAHDLMAIKDFVDRAENALGAAPAECKGDFTNSIVALAFGISRGRDLDSFSEPATWREQVQKKMLKIYYSDDIRNRVVEWAKSNGYNTSTYLGNPIVKFTKIYIIIDRIK